MTSIEDTITAALAKQDASDLVEWIGFLADLVQKRSTAECREYLGKELAELASGTAARDQQIIDMMTEDVPGWHQLTDDFRAGIAFAAALVADDQFEY